MTGIAQFALLPLPGPGPGAEKPAAGRRTVVFSLAADPRLAPDEPRPMYFGCCYLAEPQRYEYIDPRRPRDVARLLSRLADATELVTFNGSAVDLLILREHHGLSGPVPVKGRHTDLAIVPGAQGHRIGLDAATRLNLRAPRLDAASLEYDPENRRHARQACQSDVRQIHQLWKLHKAGVLRYP